MGEDISYLTDQLVRRYLDYRGGPLVVVADAGTRNIANSMLVSAAQADAEMRQSLHLIDLDAYQRPLTTLPDDLRHKLEDALNGPDEHHNTLIYLQRSMEGEYPMRKGMIAIALPKGKVGALPNCDLDQLTAAYHPSNIPEFSDELHEFILQEKEIIITCPQGTNLTVRFDHNEYTLVNSNGIIVPKKAANPIPSEVFAHPAEGKGKVYVTGSYSPLMEILPSHAAVMHTLAKDPLIWTHEGVWITDVTCQNKEIERFVRKRVFESAENSARFGECGLPTNLYIMSRPLTGNLNTDEKGRVHDAHGHGYQNRTRAKYQSETHDDGLIEEASLYSTRLGTYFMINGQYVPNLFATLRNRR